MTTLENTISMIQVLPEIDLLRIQDFTRRLTALKKDACPFAPIAKDDVMKELAVSEKQITEQASKPVMSVVGDLKNEYGL